MSPARLPHPAPPMALHRLGDPGRELGKRLELPPQSPRLSWQQDLQTPAEAAPPVLRCLGHGSPVHLQWGGFQRWKVCCGVLAHLWKLGVAPCFPPLWLSDLGRGPSCSACGCQACNVRTHHRLQLTHSWTSSVGPHCIRPFKVGPLSLRHSYQFCCCTLNSKPCLKYATITRSAAANSIVSPMKSMPL